MRKCSTMSTKHGYSNALMLYFRWLKGEKEISMDLDELVADHISCVYDSQATDMLRRTKHENLLDEYINDHLIAQGASENYRLVQAAAIRTFYKRNDAALVGDFEVVKQALKTPDTPLEAADVRQVLRQFPPHMRVPSLDRMAERG
jgi:hypothetical protein